MRENTKWIMLVTALAFVGLMVFQWGMDITGRNAPTGNGKLGSVNGDPITYEEFTETYRQLYQQAQSQAQQPISRTQNSQIEDQAWQQIVSDRLIEQELKRRGIGVTRDEIIQAARYAPPPEFLRADVFQTNGQFDLDKYHQFLANNDPTLLTQLEAYYRSVLPRNKLFQQVAAGAYVTDDEAWRVYRERNETVNIRFIALDPATLIADDAVAVSDEEIQSYYRENRDDFERPASAKVKYVAISRAPTAADTAAARSHAEALRAEIQDGADFAEVAQRESSDQATADNGGSLGTVSRGQMVPAFDQAIWSLPVGRVSQPVLTQYGFHLIQVQSRDGDQADVRHILVPIERTYESEDALLTRVDSLETLLDSETLEAAASTLGLRIRDATLNPHLPMIAGLGNIQEGVDWAFGDALPPDVSPVFETASDYYVLELVESTPARRLTLEEATPTIHDIIQLRKKRERARALGRDMADRAKAGTSLDSVAAAHGLEVQEAGPFTRMDFVPGIGAANAAIGTAFGLPVGAVSDLVETDRAFYIIRVTHHHDADRATFESQRDQLKARLTQAQQQERINRFLSALREDADIVDNRDQVLQPAQQAQASF